MSTRTMIAAAVLMGALAAPATAQQHQHGQMQGQQESGSMMSCPMMQQMMQGMHGQTMEGMDGMHDMQGMQGQMMGQGMMGMMGAMHRGPGMILQSSEALALTPDQTEQLETLQEQVRSEHQQHMQAAMAAHRQAATALEGDAPDLDAYRAALDEAADHMVTAHVAMTRAGLDAREALTPEQREKLAEVMGGMHGMQGGMMQHGKTQSAEGGSGHAGHH